VRPPQTVAEFLNLVDEAIFEMDELAICAEEDLDDEMTDLVQPFRSISHELRRLHEQVKQGKHQFADGNDLPVMPLVRRYRHVIPIYQLLDLLNQAHRQGAA
jgi:hypothetical protein